MIIIHNSTQHKKMMRNWNDNFFHPHTQGESTQFNIKLVMQYAFMALEEFQRGNVIARDDFPVNHYMLNIIARYINTKKSVNTDAINNTDKLIDYYKPLLFKIIDNSISEYDKTLYTITNGNTCSAWDFKFIASLPKIFFNQLIYNMYTQAETSLRKTSKFVGIIGTREKFKVHVFNVKRIVGSSTIIDMYSCDYNGNYIVFNTEDPIDTYIEQAKYDTDITIEGMVYKHQKHKYNKINKTCLTNVTFM